MMSKKVWFWVWLLVWSANAKAQTAPGTLLDRASSHYENEAYDDAIELALAAKEATPIAAKEDSLFVVKCLRVAGDAAYAIGQYETAKERYIRAIYLCGDFPEAMVEKGRLYYDRSFAEDALAEYHASHLSALRASHLLAAAPDTDYDFLISVYVNLAYNMRNSGFFSKAENYLKKAEREYQKSLVEAPDLIAENNKRLIIQYGYVLLYADKGDEGKMLVHLRQLEAIGAQQSFSASERNIYRSALNAVADLYINEFETFAPEYAVKQAFSYLDRSHQIMGGQTDNPYWAQYKFNLNKVYQRSGDLHQALAGNNQLLELTTPDDPRQPFFIAQRGLILLGLKKYDEAAQLFQEMASYIHQGSDTLLPDGSNFAPGTTLHHVGLLSEMADKIRGKDHNNTALTQFTAAMYRMGLAQFENCYNGSNFNQKLIHYYETTVRGILETQTQDTAENHLSLATLLEKMENIENRLAWKAYLLNRYATLPDDAIETEQRFRSQIAKLRQEQDRDNYQLFELEEQLKRLTDSLQRTTDFNTPEFTTSALQKTLGKDKLVVRYALFKDQHFLFTISADSVGVSLLPNAPYIQELIAEYQQVIESRTEDRELAAKIASLLLPPNVHNFREVLLVPSAITAGISFETLVSRDHYLIETHTISYAPHLVFLAPDLYQKDTTAMFGPLLVFTAETGTSTNALPGASLESEAIGTFFNGQHYRGSVDTFMQKAPSAGILHLAMHADTDEENPGRSGFYFDAENTLYIDAIYGLNLHADLAVLSGCKTGVEAGPNTFETEALFRAFSHAGVPSTISSLWNIPDAATTKIITAFYRHLSEGQSKAEALRLAKLEYLSTTNEAALKVPFYWGGMVLNGDGHALPGTQRKANEHWLWWAICGFLLGFFLLWWRVKRA